MIYIAYTVLTTTESSDAIAYLLEQEGALGISIEDPFDFMMLNKDKKYWDYTDLTLIEALGTDVKVIGYFIDYIDDLEEKVKRISEYGLNIGKGQIITSEVDEEDWSQSWKKYFKPFKVSERIVIKPTWEKYDKEENDIVVEIDPGMAFGTGNHETTNMCLKFLDKYVEEGNSIIDVGCGSGILGIAAAKLGAKEVLCIDLDKNACKTAKDNVVLNNVSNIINVKRGNLLNSVNKGTNMIVANIIADIIINLAARAFDLIKPGGYFISSGIISERKNDVIKELQKNNFKILEIMEMGQWCSIVGRRK